MGAGGSAEVLFYTDFNQCRREIPSLCGVRRIEKKKKCCPFPHACYVWRFHGEHIKSVMGEETEFLFVYYKPCPVKYSARLHFI